VTPTAATWQGQVQYMRDWMFQRATWLDSTAGWGGPTTPVPGTTTPPPATGTPPPADAPGCTATYRVTGQWSGGFQGAVRVTAGAAAVNGWRVSWTFATGQSIGQSWEASVTTSGTTVTAANAGHNGALAAGASTEFGFVGSWTGTNTVPTPTCTAA
ncbi:cellulose binding domain-containing protein, partial [Plantactinospora sp. CA-290183]|uniref:cellulose binding domain-containing protein n=1 Tax=Plantactinospora sp. CA-290183 TaxID=3240006 RepID=UPI003D8D00EA